MVDTDPVPALKRQAAEEVRAAVQKLSCYAAAQALGVGEPRVSDLRRGRIDRFSLERLIRMLAAVDRRVAPLLRAANVSCEARQ